MYDLGDLADVFVAGVYLFVGVNNLDLYLRRRDRPSHLWLALTCSGALMVNLSAVVIRTSESPPTLLYQLNLLGAAVATAALYEFVVSLGRGRADRVGRSLEVLLVLVLLLSWAGVDRAVGPLIVACAGLLVVSMVRAVQAGRQGSREARIVGRGFLFLSICLLLDLLMEAGLLARVSGLPPLGFTVLFLASTHSLNDRFDRAHRELETLRRDLEQRVASRTRELSEANERLAEASRTDALTGLPNRRGFLERAETLLATARRTGQSIAVVMGDLDHFKQVNDSHGHAAGDSVLCQVATTIRQAVREQDLVARWGGEEFILLLPDTDLEGGVVVAEAARRAVRGTTTPWGGEELAATISFGVASHDPTQPLDSAFARADAALYQAKEGGRDRVESAALPKTVQDRSPEI